MYQEIAWQITLLLVIVVLAIFAFVAWKSGARQDDYAPLQRRSSRIRAVVFWGLALICVPILFLSLTDLPYSSPAAGTGTPQVIEVTGKQWEWSLSSDSAVVEEPVEFHVTSSDVNHGLGLYDAELRLIAQTQAMPGYTNVLRHTFAEPGTYKILCLEYCGLAHHAMVAELRVAAR
ncbi:MAG: cytochrome C oxidase subunit II [Gammaproteobacteria bacterium]